MQSKQCKIVAAVTMQGVMIKREISDELQIPTKAIVSYTKFIGKQTYVTTSELYRYTTVKDRKYCLLARFALDQCLETDRIVYKNFLPSGEPVKAEKYEPGVDLLENQTAVWNHLRSTVYNAETADSGMAGCILVMGTGLGKTYVGGAFMEYVRCKTMIVVPNTTPIKEWRQMIKACFPGLTIGEYHSRCKCDGDVVIMTINSALSKTFRFADSVTGNRTGKINRIGKNKGSEIVSSDEYLRQFGAVIYDEVHDYAAPKRKEIFWRFNPKYCLGLTATPDERADGMDAVTHAHVGPVIRAENIPGFDVEEIQWIGEVRAVLYTGPPEHTRAYKNHKGWTDTQKSCEQFIADPYRNALLIQCISELYAEGKNTFVFSERREYLFALQQYLTMHGIVTEAPQSQTLMGGATDDDKLNAESHARIILITYGYGIQSLSIPKMDAIVFATPRRRKMRQTLGRILRRSGDPSSKRIIVDIVDVATSLKSQFSTRKGIYQEKAFDILKKNVSFQDIKV